MARKILGVLSRREAERLLTDLANLPDSQDKTLQWLWRRHEQVFKPLQWDDAAPRLNAYEMLSLGNHLRKAWDASDRRIRDWYIFQLRRKFSEWSFALSVDYDEEIRNPKPVDWFEQCPQVTFLEAAMFYFQTALAHRAKHCGGMECPAPYFVATRKGQKHCSEKCAAEATREAKRRWWAENRAKNGGLK
jgi:hypothetical protein